MDRVNQELEKLRKKRYPAYVLKMSKIMNVEPYYLMPLWTTVESEVERAESDNNLSDMSIYLKTVKSFREVIISRKLVTPEAIERFMRETNKTAEDTD